MHSCGLSVVGPGSGHLRSHRSCVAERPGFARPRCFTQRRSLDPGSSKEDAQASNMAQESSLQEHDCALTISNAYLLAIAKSRPGAQKTTPSVEPA